MVGTLLLDDLHDSISQQLGDYASSLGSAVQGAQQAIAPVPLIPTPQVPDPNAILQELQQHAAAVAQAAQEQAQPAVQVLGQGVGGAVTQLGGAKDAVTQQLLQHAQDVASGAQDVNQQLQNHVQTVLGAATPSEPGGVQSLARPTPSPVLGAPSGDQNAPPVLGATTGAVNQPADVNAAAPSGMGPIDSSSPSAFARSIAPYAQYAATKLGIDPTWVAAMAGSESNYGKAQGNELFGVKALPGQPGMTMMTHEGEYGGTQMNQTFASYATPLDAVNAWVDLIKNHYPGAVNAQDLPSFVHGLRQGGYFTATEPEYLGIVKGIGDRIGPDVQAGLQAVGIAPKGPSVATTPPVTTAQARAADLGYTDVSQFGDKQLSADEAYAACGPAAAVRFAERFGRNPTLREATDLAKQVGWTSSGGMAGIQSEQQLLKNMGVDTHIVAPDWLAIAKEAQTGNPVTISTPGHYYFADGYNPDTGAFHVGQSGLDLKNGAEWMTPQQMENLMGKAQGALFADNPNVPAKGASPTALGGTAAGATQNAPITMGTNQPARAPLVVEDQTPTPIRAAQDVLGAAGEAASQLGTTAQDLLAQAQELNRVQPGTEAIKAVTPILGGAAQAGGSAVSQVAQDVQNAAQGVLGAAQDVNRLTPGTTAVNAAAPVLGAAASDLGTGAQRAVQDLGDSGVANALLRQGRTPAEQAEFERQQGQVLGGIAAQANAPAPTLNAGDVARNAWDLVVNSSPGLPGVSLQDYQHASTVKNDWIEQNNPAKDVLLLGGLTTMIAQQVTDPYALTMFGFTGGAGGVAGEAAGEAATAATANRLGQQGAAFVGRVANKLVDGSIVGGVQNALYAAEQPNASPESVFTALWQGAALGSAAEGGTAALTPVARRIGQAIIDQAPRLRPAVAEFARSETGAAGRPSDVAAVRDEQAGRAAPVTPAAVETPRTPIGQGGLGTPRYEYPTGSTPQVISDTLRTAAERDRTGVAHVDSQSMGSLPSLPRQTLDNGKAAPAWQQGISPHLDDLRYAQDVGMNQSHWYSKFAQAVASVVGDQNVNEFRTLFGITSQQTPPTENLQYTLGLMRMAREFTANGTDFTPANIKQWIADNPRVTSTGTQGAKWKMNNDQFKKVAQLYTTGEVKVATNAKTSSYASNILSALMNRFDPNSTMDTWIAQIFNYKNPNRTASSDQAFQAMRTVVDHLAGETGQVPHQAQAAMWFAIKGAKDFAASRAASPTLKAMVKDFTNGRTTLRQVLDRAGSEGAYANPTGTWEQVSKDLGVTSELAKLQPHLDSGAPRPAIADSSYLYYPGKGTKLSGAEKIAGSAPRVSGVVPETTAYRAAAAERQAAVAETALPQSVRDTLRYDPETRQFGELRGIPHEVQGDQILVPGGNMDTLRYVAARVHEAAGPEAAPATLYTYRPESPDVVGWQILDIPAGQKQQLLDDLRASGIGHQELNDGTIGVNALLVRSADHEDAIGDAVQRAGAQYAEIHGHVEEASPGQSAVALERYGTRYADGGGVPEPGRSVAGSAGFRATEPIGRFFTPTAAGGGLRGPVEPGGFRAPVTPDDLNVRTISQQEARQLVGPAYEPSTRTTQRPPPGGTPELDRLNEMYDGKKPAPPSSVADRLQSVSDSLTRAFTDRQVDINRAQERYAANLGRPLRGDEMAAELQRLAADPVAQVKVDEGLKPAIQSVGADYPALRNYVTLRSNIEIADNLAARTGKPQVGDDRMFSGGLTRDESVKALQDLEQQLGPARFARVQAAADQVTAFNNSLRQRLVQAGVLDEGTAAQLEAQYPNWAKTRILDYMADPAGGQGAGTKLGLSDRGLREYTLKGTDQAREDPIASTVAYAHQVERMAMKNEAFQAFLKIDQVGENPMLHEVPQSYTPKSNETTMIGFIDGQKQKYVTDNKALGAAINGASVLSTPEWTSAWQKIFRSLATSRNPLFLAGNAALDIPTYVLRSSVREGGPQALPRILGELARGYGDAFQGLLQGEFRGAGTSEFLKGGGGQSGYFTGGEGQTKQAVAEMQRKNVFQINGPEDLARLTKDLLTLHPVEALGERIELGPRVAAMRLAQRRGANPTQAIIDGRTVTVDFSQGGTVTKYLNNFIPFFNVGFQGPAQLARAFRDNPRAFVATVGTLLGVPSAAAEIWNRSDPQRAKDYADVPQYVKDQGIVVMLPGEAPVDAQGNRKPMYAVIKLREWTPFATLAREATDRALGDDSRSWQEMASSTLSGVSPIQAQNVAQAGTEPLGGIPILPAAAQLGMNTDFFRGRTIVTQRADQNASAAAKMLTPAIQAIVDRAGINAEIRPSAIDFLIRNQGAGVGGAALGASDLAGGQPSDTAGATGLPGVGGLIGRFAGNQTGNELQQARDNSLSAESRQALRNNGITTTPGPVSSSVNQIPLKLDEETKYQQLANQYIDQAIRHTTASPDFARMTQVGKQSMMDQAIQAARQKAGIEVLNTIPAAEKSRRLKTKSTAPVAA